MKEVLFATGNPSKVKRFSNKLAENGIKIISLNDIGCNIEIEEDGKSAIENALIKARAYAKKVDMPVFAMDDSLYLENVPKEKQPGLFVRRVNGKRLSDNEMITYYSGLVNEYGINGKITCKWIYGMAIINNEKESTYSWSRNEFDLVNKPSDRINPGYPLNSISINKKLNKYFTDLTEEEKNMFQDDESDVIDFLIKNIK